MIDVSCCRLIEIHGEMFRIEFWLIRSTPDKIALKKLSQAIDIVSKVYQME